MATLSELSAKVDELQVALDTEQAQIADAITALNDQIAALDALVADGGSAEDRQAVVDRLSEIKTDLEGTVPDEVS